MAFNVAKAANWIHAVHKSRAVVGWWPAQYTTDDERTAYKVQDAKGAVGGPTNFKYDLKANKTV